MHLHQGGHMTTSVELFPMDVGTFRLKRRCRASVSAGGHLPQCKRVGATSRAFVQKITLRGRKHMSYRTPAIAIAFAVCIVSAGAIFAQSAARQSALTRSRYLPQYTASGELKLPENSIWREWVFVGEPLTPNALNGGQAGFPEYHNVYIEPGSYDIYRKTGIFPDGTIFFKELQLTLPPAENRMAHEKSLRGGVISLARSMARM